jgi:hypothetical protein
LGTSTRFQQRLGERGGKPAAERLVCERIRVGFASRLGIDVGPEGIRGEVASPAIEENFERRRKRRSPALDLGRVLLCSKRARPQPDVVLERRCPSTNLRMWLGCERLAVVGEQGRRGSSAGARGGW